MLIIPAIDIKEGRCVRLYQGEMEKEVVYSTDPLEVARRWSDAGAEAIHVVDLDGAVSGNPVNSSLIRDIISSTNTPVQVGGGVRDIHTIQTYLDMGAWRIVLGTVAVYNIEYTLDLAKTFPGRVVVSLDSRNGKVAVKGWKEVTEVDTLDLARRFEGSGIGAIVYTNINRDGTLKGPDVDGIERLVRSVNIPIIASGGVSTIDDIKRLKKICSPGVEGVIIGKALYSGAIDLREALSL